MTHGGKRARAGRPPRAGVVADYQAKVWLTEAERAELIAALRDGEALADLLREGGLQLARRRKPKETTMATKSVPTDGIIAIRISDGYLVGYQQDKLSSEDRKTLGTSWGWTADPREIRKELESCRDEMGYGPELRQQGWTLEALVERRARLERQVGALQKRLGAIAWEGWQAP